MLVSKEENFHRFKAIAGITFVIAIIIAFINIISAENATLQFHEYRSRFSTPRLIMNAPNQ